MKRLFALLLLISGIAQQGMAQQDKPWKGKKAAVVLTYDDAIDEHLDNAIPVLDSLQLKATFYVTAFSNSVQTRLNEWKKLAAHGHELGNHTLYHPCMGAGPGREWVKPENDLSKYSVQRIENEARMTNVFLQALDGKTKRTFAYTCGDMVVADSFFMNGMHNDFVAARAVRNEMHTIDKIDLYNVDCYMVNNHTAAQMQAWVEQAKKTNSLLVILFHGVGGGNGLNVSQEEHRKFLLWLKKQQKDIWIAPMLDVATYVQQKQKR
ncbi:MAG TPA: polysaccharide deacetylase family protein [Phnomibacter sp.]|nr:polysaccharide deacetylase family protein [Phnomibacter sp.]